MSWNKYGFQWDAYRPLQWPETPPPRGRKMGPGTETPRRSMGPGSHTGCDIIQRHFPPPRTKWHMLLKLLPCPKHRLREVIITVKLQQDKMSTGQSEDLKEPFPLSVADPGFSRGGAWTLQGGREHAKFSRKLHEIERIWTPRGGRASLTPPPRSANVFYQAMG